jgi:hypothetical protein
VFAGLAAAALLLLRTALVQGPLWFRDYSLYGMQYGARQVFEMAIPELLRGDPAALVLVTSTWANGTDNFLYFFLDDEQRCGAWTGSICFCCPAPLTPQMLFIMTC